MKKVDTSNMTKLYYSISDVADMFDVNMSLIRFWEKEFPILQPKKNKRGNRYYSPKEIDKLNTIYHLVKVKGYTLDGAKKAMKNRSEDTEAVSDDQAVTSDELITRLEKVREQLIELRSKL